MFRPALASNHVVPHYLLPVVQLTPMALTTTRLPSANPFLAGFSYLQLALVVPSDKEPHIYWDLTKRRGGDLLRTEANLETNAKWSDG